MSRGFLLPLSINLFYGKRNSTSTAFKARAQGCGQRQKQGYVIQERPDPCHSAQRNSKMEADRQRHTAALEGWRRE